MLGPIHLTLQPRLLLLKPDFVSLLLIQKLVKSDSYYLQLLNLFF